MIFNYPLDYLYLQLQNKCAMDSDMNSEPQLVDEELQRLIDGVKDENTKLVLQQMAVRFRNKEIQDEERFETLKNLYDDIENRLREQEKYSSKDSVIIRNPPFDARDSVKLFDNIKWFCKIYLKVDIVESDLKAYHILPSKNDLPNHLTPPVILKFVQFPKKDLVYRNRKYLKRDPKNNHNPTNPMNNKLIYLNERLPPIENLLKRFCDNLGYITSSHNCNISVLCCDKNDPSGDKKVFIAVKNISYIKNLYKPVLKNANVGGNTSANPFKRNHVNADLSPLMQSDKLRKLFDKK